jgi:hypothetical protein
MRLSITMSLLVIVGICLGGCSGSPAVGNYIADNLPPWAGGLPKNTPPRPGSARYAAYLRAIKGQPPLQTVQRHHVKPTKVGARVARSHHLASAR